MAKQSHDIGYQKQLRREEFAQAQPRKPKRRGLGPMPPELVHLLNLHSLEGTNHLQRINSEESR